MKVRIEGICEREYTDTKTGQLATAVELHCVRMMTPQENGMRGNMTIVINANHYPHIKKLQLNQVYSCDVETFVGKNGRFTRLVYVEGI